MEEYKNSKLEDFNNMASEKKVAIIGLGVSNIPLLDYFFELGSKIAVFDNNKFENLNDDLKKKINDYKIDYYGGENNLEKLVGYDIIFRSPSIMPYRKELVAEKERGALITSEIELVLELSPSKIIGVTGTEGKTTTTSIIYEIVKKAGYNCFLGGNIGKPIFTQIKNMTPNDVVVLELSSFQLIDMKVSPNIALVTNIYPDHLNIHGSYEEYQNAKKNIFTHQKKEDVVVLNYDNEITRNFAKDVKSNVIFFSSKKQIENGYIYDNNDGFIKYCENGAIEKLVNKNEIKLRGIHNYENICAAFAVTSSIVDRSIQIEVIKEFMGVEHRLEFVRLLDGVKWYNDSIGTSPASTIAGLNAFDENIVLLAGGSDKGLDYTEVGEAIANKVGTLILCGPTAPKIEQATNNALIGKDKNVKIYHVKDLYEAVILAKEVSNNGDVVLLSPASASFDAFKNFAERGNKFKEWVKNLK